MGFIGMFTGGQRKREAERTAGEARTLRGEIGGFRTGLEGIRTAPRPDVETMRSAYTGMITDPTKRGFSPETRSAMFARQAEVGAGSRQAALRNIQRQSAAGGMTNTGQRMRAAMELEPQYQAQQRGAQRDIDIASEELGRKELFGSLEGLGGVQRGEDIYNLQNLGMQQGTYGQQLGTFDPQMAAQQQAYQSKWGPALTGILGSAIGGAGAGFGYGMGARAAAPKPSPSYRI